MVLNKFDLAANPMNILVELMDRNRPEAGHDPLHVDVGFRADDIRQYLNSVFGQDRRYRFYINNAVFDGSLQEEVSLRNLETERGLRVEYEAEDEVSVDLQLELDDTLSFLKVFGDKECWEIWCCAYGGLLRIYECRGGAVSMRETVHRDVRGAACGDKMCLHTAHEVMGCDGEVVFRTVENISCISVEGETVYVGTLEGGCYVVAGEARRVHGFSTEVVSVQGGEFVSLDGHVGVCRDGFERRRVGQSVTAVDSGHGARVFGTSLSRLEIERDGAASSLKTKMRFARCVAVHSRDIVAAASQHVVSVLNIQTSAEIRRISVDETICNIGWMENMLLVGAGTSIRGYNINK